MTLTIIVYRSTKSPLKLSHSSAYIFLAELLDFFEIVPKEFDGLLDVTVVHHARVAAQLFGQDLFRHIFVQLVEGVVELDVILGKEKYVIFGS